MCMGGWYLNVSVINSDFLPMRKKNNDERKTDSVRDAFLKSKLDLILLE